MALPAVQNQRRTLLFCNGINTPEWAAKRQAEIISRIFSGERVHVVHNPTDMWGYGYAKYSAVGVPDQRELVQKLVDALHEKIAGKGEDHVLLAFAHSHGAELLYEALTQLQARLQDVSEPPQKRGAGQELLPGQIHVHTFGAAKFIPLSLAKSVHNYIFPGDLISSSGVVLSGQKSSILTKIQKAAAGMQEGDEEVVVQHKEEEQTYEVTVLKERPFVLLGESPQLEEGLWDGLKKIGKVLAAASSHALEHHVFEAYEAKIHGIKASLEAKNVT